METVVETVVDDNTSVDTGNESIEDTSSYSFDDLLSIDSESIEEFKTADHKGMKPLHEWVKHVPPDVRKHLSNLRADYTRKTQALSDERDRYRSEYESSKATLESERAALYTGEYAQKIKALAEDTTEYNIYDEAEKDKFLDREAAKKVEELLAPAREKMSFDQRQFKLDKFKAENPDMTLPEYRVAIAEKLMTTPGISVEDAYYVVKAKIDSMKLAEERKAIADKRTVAKTTFNKTSVGRPVTMSVEVPAEIKKQGAWAIAQYHKKRLGED